MGIKLFTISLLLTQLAFSQAIEVQRKYDIKKQEALFKFVRKSDKIGGFKTETHAELRYFDLYFDTPEFDLADKGFSLRMRKKIMPDDCYYTFQLKSEMENATGVRMEVDEPELVFYLLMHEDEPRSLAVLLDQLFDKMMMADHPGYRENYQAILKSITQWISLKKQSTISPFQKLRHIDAEFFTFKKIASLEPKIIGMSLRKRTHIYLTKNKAMEMTGRSLINRQRGDKEPEFFKANRDYCWLMEASLDSASFYPLFDAKIERHDIIEYELENKFGQDSISFKLMDIFEKKMTQEFELEKSIDSKYLQSIKAFREE